ncbi:MAG: glycosyltransferase [Pseudomonadota bacterium]
MNISIVIRTLNEAAHLDELLTSIAAQELPVDWNVESVIVDSGSTDETLTIAHRHACRVTHIAKADFSFGRSLNQGCAFATGDVLVFVSGHCVPTSNTWLIRLIEPLAEQIAVYSYGRQEGRGPTKFSERRVFQKYFPETSQIPQDGFFINNANAAILRRYWDKYRFDEELTGLEDMHLGKRLVDNGERLAYVADASVYHIHDESWHQVRNRYEREGMALAGIMPEAAMTFVEFVECTVRSVLKDSYAAMQRRALLAKLPSIVAFRFMQYWGSYRGTRLARHVARAKRRSYFYPDQHLEHQQPRETHAANRTTANERA